MSQAPSMPMYWDAYIADTTHLTTEEHGAYMLLLGAMWRRNGWVPDDDRDNARILGLTPAKWRKVKARLSEFLTYENGEITSPFIVDVELRFRKENTRPAVSTSVQREVRERDGNVCQYCGGTEGPFHLDHIFPWSRGGSHSPDNLCVSCARCNLEKGNKTVDEWRGLQ